MTLAGSHSTIAFASHNSASSLSQTAERAMMRIAVAGTGGLARAIAHRITEDTSHTLVFLSRSEKLDLIALGFQIAIVDYFDDASLKFALRGIDTVISTVMGPSQIELIKAAVAVKVRRFAPAEFEGSPQCRDPTNMLDNGRSDALRCLAHFRESITSTSFVCGIFYERLFPGGLAGAGMGTSTGLANVGDYIIDWACMTAETPAYGLANENVYIRMTAVEDVARFVTRALDLLFWPPEMRMSGQRISVSQLVADAVRLRGMPLVSHVVHSPATLLINYQHAYATNDYLRQINTVALINTAHGYYDFDDGPSLNEEFGDLTPVAFDDWFRVKWAMQSAQW